MASLVNQATAAGKNFCRDVGMRWYGSIDGKRLNQYDPIERRLDTQEKTNLVFSLFFRGIGALGGAWEVLNGVRAVMLLSATSAEVTLVALISSAVGIALCYDVIMLGSNLRAVINDRRAQDSWTAQVRSTLFERDPTPLATRLLKGTLIIGPMLEAFEVKPRLERHLQAPPKDK